MPDDALGRAEAALAEGRLDAAEALAREALSVDATRARAWRVAGLAAFRADRPEEARRYFSEERKREADPAAQAVTDFNLGGATFKLGLWSEAEASYLAAATAPALEALARLNAGIAADNAGQAARAVEHYRASIAAAGRLGETAVVEQARERLAEAEKAAHEAQRDEAWQLARAGSTALKAGSTDEAVAKLETAAARASAAGMTARERADLDYALGHALLSAHRTDEALAAFRRAAEASPADAEFHYMLAVTLDRRGDGAAAAAEFQRSLDAGLSGKDAEQARRYLADRPGRPASARIVVETQLSAGYDTHYAGGREAPFRANAARANATDGAPELLVEVEPRLRLLGRPAQGLLIGDRIGGVMYLSADADPYTLLENALYLEGAVSPREWLALSATAEGYVQTAGLTNFGLYQAGGLLALRALFLEGDLLSTRLRYAATYMHALQTAPPTDFGYMTGWRHEASLFQSIYPGRFRLSLGYAFTAELVGTQHALASDVIGDDRAAQLRGQLGIVDPTADPTYAIPYSYYGNAVAFEGDGDVPGQLRLTFGARYEHRRFLDDITLSPDPASGYHRRREDDRISFDASIKRELFLGVQGRISLYVLVSRSNIRNTDAASPFDFDDKNYLRFIGTFDLLRNF